MYKIPKKWFIENSKYCVYPVAHWRSKSQIYSFLLWCSMVIGWLGYRLNSEKDKSFSFMSTFKNLCLKINAVAVQLNVSYTLYEEKIPNVLCEQACKKQILCTVKKNFPA